MDEDRGPKITPKYLHQMEEKIFHVRPSKDNTKAFPKELFQQLSEHRRFQGENPVVDILKKDSENSWKSSATGSSRQRVEKLFNPYYDDQSKNLLESIRTKVFGFVKKFTSSSSLSDEEEWCADPLPMYDTLMKFPKETRHAVSSLSFGRTEIECAQCSRKITTVDAQTSPVHSCEKVLKIVSSASIPCPLNILCDKGIHLGKCDEKLRRKVVNCNCKCKKKMLMFSEKDLKYPGKAQAVRPLAACKSFLSKKQTKDTSTEKEDSKFEFVERKEKLKHISEESVSIEKTKAKEEEEEEETKMNGLNNGHANGELNGCGDIITQNQQKGCWTIGLINSKYRYLTAESFGFKINANGVSLKKKQIWTLEPENANSGDSLIYLRSHLDKYLAVDSFGNVTCESDEKDAGCQFQISVSEDGSGRWALKNVVRGYFLGSTQDKLTCTAKVPGDAEFWHVHLAARPQVNLRSVGRKRFAHLSENLDEIHVDANIPWGEDTLFTLEFRLDESGKYAIHTCNNKYLSMGGKLVDTCTKDCLFSAEYHSGQLALRDRTGTYLSPIGSKAVLKTRSNTVTKDELFSLEDSLPQASFVASLNSRFVSVKQGVDVTANQDEISDHETFQLEFDWSTKRWYIRTMQDRYWTLETGGGIQASGEKRSSNALFDLVWQKEGSVAFRANNGRYVITKRSGHLYATSDAIDDNCKYFFYLINRPILVLKCEQGFVGYKSASSPKLECNKATYECIQVERGEKGVVHFKGQNGKYWHVDSEGVTCDSDSKEGFYLELREPTRLCIKSVGGNYLTASKNGLFRLGDTAIENATQWEY